MNALFLNGQVQVWIDQIDECTGSLIDTQWVLTAKHCIIDNHATVDDTYVMLGDLRLQLGETHFVSGIYLNPDHDVALIRLTQPTNQLSLVKPYGLMRPNLGDRVILQGWGHNENGPLIPPAPLQASTQTVIPFPGDANPNPGIGPLSDVITTQSVFGLIEEGDSGAGVFDLGLICGVISESDAPDDYTYSVATDAVAGWILQTSGVSDGGVCSTPPLDPLPPPTVGETTIRKPDPSVILDQYTPGFYGYLSVEEVNDDGVAVRQAGTLPGLSDSRLVTIWEDTKFTSVWAPEIMRIDGTYYVYFSADTPAGHRMFVIHSSSPTSGYTAPQELMLPNDKWAIDGTTFVYKDQRWFLWSGWQGDANVEQNLYLARMTDPVTTTGPSYQISQPHEPWEHITGNPNVNEGPEAVLDPNGQLHVVYSANGSWSDAYCLGDLRLKAGGDPSNVWDWHKSNGCEFGSHNDDMEPDGWYPTLYANGPGHHTFALLEGDINNSPKSAYPATAEFMYHAVPKGMNYSWPNRVRYVGAYTWYNDINYNRCCVPGDNTDTGYSLMFFEDPNYTPHPPPSGPPPGGSGSGGSGGSGGPGGPVPGATGIHNADPSVIRVGSSTYISVETGNNQTAILKRQASSPGGLGQAQPTVLNQFSSGTNAIWAPEIQIIDGYYYVYFSADIGADHRMFYARFTSDWVPAGGGQLDLPDNKWAVDGNTFVFNGQRYFVWSGVEDGDPNEQNLYLVKMTDPTTPTGPRYRISQPHESWERVTGGPPNNYINEAPAAIIDPDGRLHIVYSANGSWTDQYCLADLRLVASGDPTNVWDWHKSNGCQFGSNRATIAPGYDPTLYVNGPGSHSFVLLNGDIGFSPTPAAPVPLTYHAVPKGTSYSWDNRMWFNGAFQWYHGPDYTRCCVPGSTDDAGWSIKFYEDPNFGK